MAKHESKELMNEFFKDFNKHFDEEMNKAEERMSKKTKKAVEDGVSDGIKQAVSNLDIGTLNIGINDVNVSEKELKQALQKGLLEASKKAASSLKTEIDLTDTVVVNDDIIKKRINKLTETLEINYNKVFEKGQKLTRKQAESYGESFLELERYLKTSGSNIPEKYQQLMTNLQKNVNSNAGTIKLDSMVSTANGNFDYFFERAKSSIIKQQKQLINEVSQAQKALLDVVNNSNVGNDTPPTAITKIGEEAEKSAEKVRELNNEIEKPVKTDILSGSQGNQIPVLSDGDTAPVIEQQSQQATKSIQELEEELQKLAFTYKNSFHDDAKYDFEFEKNYEIANKLESILNEIFSINPDYSIEEFISRTQAAFEKATTSASDFENILKEVRKGTGKWSYNKLLNNPEGFSKELDSVADEYYAMKNSDNYNEKDLLNIEARFTAMLSAQHKLFNENSDYCRGIFDQIQGNIKSTTSDLQDQFWEAMANGSNMSSKFDLEQIVKDRLGIKFGDVADDFEIEKLQELLSLLKDIEKIKSSISKESLISNQEQIVQQNSEIAKELEDRLRNTSLEDRESDPEWVENQYKYIAEYINKAEEAKAKIAELKNEIYELKTVTAEDIKKSFLQANQIPLLSEDSNGQLSFIEQEIQAEQKLEEQIKETNSALENQSSSIPGQISLNDYLSDLEKQKQQTLETAQAKEKLTEARNESSPSASQSPIEQRLQKEKETVDEVVNAEITSFDELITHLDTNVIEAIETKTSKFENERDRVHNVVEDEIGEIDRLIEHISEVAPEGNININVNNTTSDGKKSIVDGEQRDDVADRVNRSKVKTTSIKNAELLSVESKEELAEAIEKEQLSIMNALEKEGEFIKEVTAFYDSADNLVKQQLKSIDKDGNVKTYTTRYSVNKDGEAQVWSSHIDNEKYVDEASKATESIKNAFIELRREAYQSIGQKSEELSKMAEYYEQQQKEYTESAKQIQNLYKSLDSAYTKAFNKEDKYPEEYSHKLEDIKSKLEELKKYKNLDIFGDKEIGDAKKLGGVIEELFTDLGNIEKKANTAKANSVAAQISQYSSALTKNTRLVKDSKTQMQGWIKELQNPDINPSRVQEIITAFGKLKVEINDAGDAGRGFVDIFKNKLKYGIAQQLAMYFSFNDFLRYGREIFNTIRELDTALVDLSKTTKMSSSEMNDFYFESNNVAKELGVTTKEVIEQASAFSRLGYSSKEASTEMAKLSSQFAMISPGMSTDESQSGLISIMKAWDLDVSEVKSVMDSINVLGNSFAETNLDITEGMQRSAAALAATGTSYQDAFALFTGAQEILQNAEVGGRALRSISLRVRGYSEDSVDGFEELDETLTNVTGDLADLTKTAQHSQGISVFKEGSTTEFKRLVDYFGEINSIWDEMSEKQQNDYLQKAFGKTQAQAGAAIIKNYDSIRDALEKMEQSSGSADAEMEKIKKSLDYKLNELSQTWVGTFQKMTDRGDIGKLIDILTGLSEAIGSVVEKAGLLGTLAIGGGLFTGIKNIGICMRVCTNQTCFEYALCA